MMILIQLTKLQSNEDTCLKEVNDLLNFAMMDNENNYKDPNRM